MLRRFSTNFSVFSIFLDAFCVGFTLQAANYLRPLLNELPFAADAGKPTVPIPLYPIFIISWVSILLLLAVYDSRRNYYVVDELTSVTLGTILAGVSLAGMLYLSYRDISRLQYLMFVLLAYISTVSWRLVARLAFRVGTGRPPYHRSVLIVGAGPVGNNVQEQMLQRPYLGFSVIGFLDDDPSKQEENDKIIGSLTDARKVVESLDIDDVVIALPRRAHEQVSTLVAELHDLPVKVWVIPDYFHLALHKARVAEFAGLPMLDLRAPALNEYQRMVKRAFDLVVGTMIQILIAPIMVIIAIAIKIDSPGPIFFKQKRVGENGHLFWMYKFRSMVIDAEERLKEVMFRDEDGNLLYKTPEDPRITRVGKFLRRRSLDELPNFFNVLLGDMSLVGPRPELPTLVKEYQPWQRKRFAVPQGITGWWQVNGRSDKPMHLHTEDDLYYVQNYSLLLDFQILIKTLWVVLRGKGAY
jgi:exopolysaccharide biosynthesis polyprenyl glycosylphosphotransferase